jgi:aminopeptidase
MRTDWIQQWARILVRYSLRVDKGSVIKVRGTTEARPLIAAVFAELMRVGAHPRVNVSLPELLHTFYTLGSREQLSYSSPIDLHEARKIDGIISIQSERNTRELSRVSPGKQVLTVRAAHKLSNIIIAKDNWVGTLFPTPSYAQDADLAVSAFEQFVARAMFLDQADPVAAWKAQRRRQDKLVRRLQQTDAVRIVARDTDLRLSIKGRTAVNDDGTHNMPGGEVFTAPVEDSAEGYIRYSYPVVTRGREISGIRLEFSRGKVVKVSADKHEPFLKKMLEQDSGATRLGELGIGTNTAIDRFIKSILFDEKIDGTVHLALGNSYPVCGGRNKSALHWDMIRDLRDGGELYFDGTLVQKDGRFVI